MTDRRTKPNALLIELVIVLLFFSLSAAVILQLFMATHDKSVRANVDSQATRMAEDVAERFYVSALSAQDFFAGDGWAEADGAYEKGGEAEGRALRFVVSGETEPTEAGVLDAYSLAVYDGATQVVTLPVVRYVPGEVTR